jgi:CDP-glucose 4,6-dehydratase
VAIGKRTLESVVVNREFWRGKSVFLTGHTGFKGGWLAMWLDMLGARVTGYALAPDTSENLFESARVGSRVERSIIADIRDLDAVRRAVSDAAPDIVIHMAAQALVRDSYTDPVGTYATNVMGTVNVLDAARNTAPVRVIAVVTSDKCYENREWLWGYREDEPMGGYDPYSSSKGCAELVTSAYRRSFFNKATTPVAVVSARAGNVIGGGDWSKDRVVPDAVRAFGAGLALNIRSPNAIRPWQHVLEPLCGYLTLVEHAWGDPARYAGGWNFGPGDEDVWPVSRLVDELARKWPGQGKWVTDTGAHPHEAGILRLDCAKARTLLQWKPRLALGTALDWIVEWYAAQAQGADLLRLTQEQIRRYEQGVSQ